MSEGRGGARIAVFMAAVGDILHLATLTKAKKDTNRYPLPTLHHVHLTPIIHVCTYIYATLWVLVCGRQH